MQAIADPCRAVKQSASAAEEQVRLIEVVKQIPSEGHSRSASESTPTPAT
jgi:hypothetical protein